MEPAWVRQEIRVMRFEELLDRHERGELSQLEAAEMLGMSERRFRRWRDRLRDEGEDGLLDRRVGKASPRRAPESELARARKLYEEMYGGFTVKHFHEKLVKRHGYKLCYRVTGLALQRAGLVRPAPRRGAHRRKRPQRPMAGMMLHQDGSTHVWLSGQRALDLIVTMDDATNEIYSAFLVAEEGTASSFRGLGETIGRQGLFCSLYTDRGSHYFYTPEAGGKVSKTQPTQVGRALEALGIEHIAAYSPEARPPAQASRPPAQASRPPAQAYRPHFVRAKVRLHEYPDGAVALFWGPHRIAYFAPDGNPRQLNQAA